MTAATRSKRRRRTSAQKFARLNVLAYCQKGRRYLPYPSPLEGEEKRKVLKQIRELALKLYPGAGRALLTTSAFSTRFDAETTHNHLFEDRAPKILPGSVGAIATRILKEVVEPRSEAIGYRGRYDSCTGKRIRPTPSNTPQQRLWRHLIYVFKELVVWFAAFPADDLTDQDLDVFVDSHDRTYCPNDYRRYMPAVRRLFREAGIEL